MAACPGRLSGRAENARGGEVEFCREVVRFGWFVEVAVDPWRVVDGLAALGTPDEVRRAVVTMPNDVTVQPSPSGRPVVAMTYLERHEKRAAEQPRGRGA